MKKVILALAAMSVSFLLIVSISCSSTDSKSSNSSNTGQNDKSSDSSKSAKNDKSSDSSKSAKNDRSGNENMMMQSRGMPDSSQIIDKLNQQLSSQVDPMYFGPYKSTASGVTLKSYVRSFFPIFKTVINKVPDGYVIQAIGHANRAPRMSEGACRSLSKRRARAVYNVLIDMGLNKSKLGYNGVGNAEPVDSSVTREDKAAWGKNRRVTFKIVPK